jgi:hypothetical protein
MLNTKQRLARMAGSYLTVFSGAAVVLLNPTEPAFLTELIKASYAGLIGCIPHAIMWCNDVGQERRSR